MPIWRNTLPPEGKNQGFDLRRTPPTGSIQGIITSECLIVVDTHYWHGRTMPCERITNERGELMDDSPCQACQQKQPYRTHVYVSAFDSKNHVHYLFECTANAAKPLEEYYQATKTLRGCIFNASRPKGGLNSKVVIATNTANQARNPIPTQPDIPKALAVIWRLPGKALEAAPEVSLALRDGEGYATKQQIIRPAEEFLSEMRTPEDDAGGETDFLKKREEMVASFLESGKKNGKPKKEKVK